jgi:hypothetical protein
MMGKHRPITAKEPIKRETVFFADVECCVDGQRSSSRLVLAISVGFQFDASCEFSLINTESLARVSKPGADMLGISNLRTPFFISVSPREPAYAIASLTTIGNLFIDHRS